MPVLAFSVMSLLAAASSSERPAKVDHLLFDLCPKVIAGEVDLADPEQVEALGFVPRAGSLGWVYADSGRGRSRISIGYKKFSDKKACKVGFGGPDNERLLRSIVEAGQARGWRTGEGAAELGGFVSFLYPPGPVKQSIMFTHWPEFDGLKPATNAALLQPDGQ